MADPDAAAEHAAGIAPSPARGSRRSVRERAPRSGASLRALLACRTTPRRPLPSSLAFAIGAWVRADRLDRALAAGTDPSTSVLLARRASQLTTRRNRVRFARALEAHLAEARNPTMRASAAIPVRREDVLYASPDLRRLVNTLREGGEVGAQGMAHTRRLLIDGASPLYARSPRGTLAQAFGAATECLHDER
jgi:hypothetical protein